MADLLITFIDLFLHLDRHLGEHPSIFRRLDLCRDLPDHLLRNGARRHADPPGGFAPLRPRGLCRQPLPQGTARGGVALHHAFHRGHRRGYGELRDRPLHRAEGLSDGKYRFLKKEYLERTHRFYEKHGGKTIVIARFIPIIRTFAPFVAGIGAMTYSRFISYNVIGGIAWIGLFIFGGYFFGNLPMIRNNFTLVIIAIVILSVLPGVIEYFRQRRETT